MAGHSQFKNIMHRKGRVDKVRSKMFSKLSREIMVSAKMGMPDPAHNPRLRAAIIAAKQLSMPKDNIQRAIDKATGANAEAIEEVRYEGYGPGGVALIVEALTDNRNRTAGDVRTAFNKSGGALGETNSVSFMFQRLGEVTYPAKVASADAMLEGAIEAGADDVESGEEDHVVLCAPDDLSSVRDALEATFGPSSSSKLVWRPATNAPVTDEEVAQSLFKFIDVLEDNDDVQTVYANFDIPDELMAKLGG